MSGLHRRRDGRERTTNGSSGACSSYDRQESPLVVIDFAHTPHALTKVLSSVSATSPVVSFVCSDAAAIAIADTCRSCVRYER